MWLIVDFIFQSCIDPIAFVAEDASSKLVIFGSFTDQNRDHEVSIRRTGMFGSLGIAIPEALVAVIDEEGNEGQYHDTGEGIYVLPRGTMQGIPGNLFKLMVTLPNGNRFESSWEKMPEPVLISNTYFDVSLKKRLSESDNVIQQFIMDIYVDTPLKTTGGAKANLRWEVEETYSFTDFQCGSLDNIVVCYYEVPREFGQLEIFRAVDDSQQDLKNHLIFTRFPAPYLEFNELHYFIVSQFSLSESTYDYWDKINIVSSPTGSVFDKIPAGVPGNITEIDGNSEVLGLFEVASVSVKRTVSTWQDVNETIQIPKECSIFIPYFFQPDYCCYCFLLPNQIPKPFYWGER